jgi:hypothetical protein
MMDDLSDVKEVLGEGIDLEFFEFRHLDSSEEILHILVGTFKLELGESWENSACVWWTQVIRFG